MDHPQISVIDREFFSHSAAALATACKIQVTADAGYYEVRNNQVLGNSSLYVYLLLFLNQLLLRTGREYARLVGSMYGMRTDTSDGAIYSTDFVSPDAFSLPQDANAYRALPGQRNIW